MFNYTINTKTSHYKEIMKTVEEKNNGHFDLPNAVAILNNINKLPPQLRTLIVNGIEFMKENEVPYFFDTLYLENLDVHEMQREVDMKKCYEVVRKFDAYIGTPIIVHIDTKTGKMEIDDGQHLAIALSIMKRTKWVAQYFVDVDIEKRGKIFATQQSKRRGLTSGAKYHAEWVTGYGNGRIFKQVADEFGVTICEKNKTYRNITSLRILERIYKDQNEDGLYYAFKMIEASPYSTQAKGYVEAVLRLAYFSYKYCCNNEMNYDILINHLKKLPTIKHLYADIFSEFPNTNRKHPEYGVQAYIEKMFNNGR